MNIRFRYVIGALISFATVLVAIVLDIIGPIDRPDPLVLQYSRSLDLAVGDNERLNAFIGQTVGEDRMLYHVIGHTSERGDDVANLDLSKRRADQVAMALKAAGVDAARIVFVGGVGSADPLLAAPDESEGARQRRMARVVVTVLINK